MTTPTTSPAATAPRRGAFTLIELLIVLMVSIVMVLLTAGPVLKSLRRASVDRSVAAITAASEDARLLARSQAGDGTLFGVRLLDDGTGEARVTVVERSASGTIEPAVGAGGKPIADTVLRSSAVIMTGASDLRGGDQELTWWFQPGSGRLLRDPARPHLSGGLGLPGKQLAQPYGLAINAIQDGTELWQAQGDVDFPGLWLQDSGSTYAVSITVYPTGIASRNRLEEVPR